ncbi:hypothetical protein C1646_777654 [Rhizophagus diaphanus]|nr:hypothetical protein C1646_777654 [Rhizophagus diaphanus] [Rhizophagus sp. MUCL 43196]
MEKKMRINRLERQLQNMERQMNNRGSNRNQQGRRDYNRVPIDHDKITCFNCNKRGHYVTKCPLRNNILENKRRINLMDVEQEEYDYEEYDETDDDDDYEDEDYDDPQLYRYEYDLYRKDNLKEEKRRDNRLNPLKGWQTFGKSDLNKEIARREYDERMKNRVTIPMDEDNDIRGDRPMYDQPIEIKIPEGYRYSKERGEWYNPLVEDNDIRGDRPMNNRPVKEGPKRMIYSKKREIWYDPIAGIRKWRDEGGKRESKVRGIHPEDAINYENLLNIKMGIRKKKEVTTAMKTQVTINNRDIETVIDSGAAISVITEKLRKELRIPITKKSDITCTLANGEKIASLGRIHTEIIIGGMIAPITKNVEFRE